MPTTTTYLATDPEFDFEPRPGRILQRELDARSISQARLSVRTGLSPKHINLVVKDVAPISPEMAVTLEQILGTPAEVWLRLESVRQAHTVRTERERSLAGFAAWAQKFPRERLLQRGLIGGEDSPPQVAGKILALFGVVSPKTFDRTWLEPQASYKRSQAFTIDPDLTALWLRLAELQAEPLLAEMPEFDGDRLRDAAEAIAHLDLANPVKAFKRAQKALRAAGVVLVFEPEVDQTRISGASRTVDGIPMIAVTNRYRYLDGMWFTMLHEIAHILLHPKRTTFIDGGASVNDDDDKMETAANKFAQELLVPPSKRAELMSVTSVGDLHALADDLGVDPCLVAGQWAFQTNNWRSPVAQLRRKSDFAELL